MKIKRIGKTSAQEITKAAGTPGQYDVLAAIWDDTLHAYRCGDLGSSDGATWMTGDGRPAAGLEFERASIRLVGGPSDGVVIR